MNRLQKISGIIKIKKLEFYNDNFEYIEFFCGGLCLNLYNKNIIITNYIYGIIEANFLSYKQIESNGLDWELSYKLNILSKSKQWDYLQFTIDKEQCKDIYFLKYRFHKNEDMEYKIYGNIDETIIIKNKLKQNLIHNLLPKQLFYLSNLKNTYNGSLIYNIINNKLYIFGYTSFNYNNQTKIIPLYHLTRKDKNIELDLQAYKFNYRYIYDIPNIRNTFYPKFMTNYFNIFKKNDIIISINNNNIRNCDIYNIKLNIYQTIDEYLIYQKNIVQFTIYRLNKNEFIDIYIDINKFNNKFSNNIYLNVDKLYDKNKLIFNTDICDNIIEKNDFVYNSDILKYLDDPYYKIKYI